MFSPLTRRLALTALVGLTSSVAFAADRTWTGTAGDTLFATPGNWDTGVPTAADAVLVGADASGENYIGLNGSITREIQSMRFLPTAGSYQITSFGPLDVLQLNTSGNALLNDSGTRQNFSQLPVQAGASQTWDGKGSGFTFTHVSLGSDKTVTFSGSGITASTRNELTGFVSGVAGTTSGITKAGSGTLYIGPSASLSYSGATTVSQGTLLLGGSNLLPDASNLVLSGGVFDIAGFDEKTGKLSLGANSTINFGISNTADLVFDASQLENWGAFTLTILDFTPGQDTLRFGTSASALTEAQLANILFDGVTAAKIDENGFVSPIPEPSAALLIGVGALVAGGFRRRRAA